MPRPPTSAAESTTPRADRRSAVELGALALIWGSSFLYITVALEGLTPTHIVAGRLLIGSVALAIAVRLGLARYPSGWAQWRLVATLAVIQNVVPFALFAWGQERVSSSVASVMNATTPLWTAAFAAAAMLPGERLSRRRLEALLAGLAGVVVIVEPWHGGGEGQIIGELACLLAAACYGVGFVFMSRNIMGKMDTMAAAVGQVASGAVIATALAVVVTATGGDTPQVDLQVLGAIVALGALSTGVAFLLSFHLVETTGPTATSAVTFLMPFVGVLLGVLVLDEDLRWTLAAGGALVLLSAVRVRPKRVAPQLSEA
jgi:drug/metabolite transporter (DMT)-like permease